MILLIARTKDLLTPGAYLVDSDLFLRFCEPRIFKTYDISIKYFPERQGRAFDAPADIVRTYREIIKFDIGESFTTDIFTCYCIMRPYNFDVYAKSENAAVNAYLAAIHCLDGVPSNAC